MESTIAKLQYNFAVEVPIKQPRAWDRVPKSPFASHRRGKKVWKRYELRPDGTKSISGVGNAENTLQISEHVPGTPSRRPVKRLRNAPQREEKEGAPVGAVYTTTLRDRAPGTPKSTLCFCFRSDKVQANMWHFLGKVAKRKSLKSELYRRKVSRHKPTEDVSSDVPSTGESPTQVRADVLRSEQIPFPPVAVVIPSPAIERSDYGDGTHAQESLHREIIKEQSEKPALLHAEAVRNADFEVGHVHLPSGDSTAKQASPPQARDDQLAMESIDELSTQPSELEVVETSLEPPIDDGITICLPAEIRTPLATPTKAASVSEVSYEDQARAGLSPAIHTSEPAGSSSIPWYSTSATRSPDSPPNISQNSPQSSEVSSPQPNLDAEPEPSPPAIVAKGHDSDAPEPLHRDAMEAGSMDHQSLRHESGHTSRVLHNTLESSRGPDQERRKDTAQSVEALEVSVLDKAGTIVTDGEGRSTPPIGKEGSKNDAGASPEVVTPIKTTDTCKAPPLFEKDQNQSLDSDAANTLHAIDKNEEVAVMPVKTTRSGARFSDDTNLLKDFLNRAQAKKLIRDIEMPASEAPAPSPRRSSRNALTELTSNPPSPQKPNNLASRPGTPPGKQRLGAYTMDDDVDELTAEPTSCRRSTRTRLPAPTKAPPGAPSFIPVRRADGTDPVVLQKSQAQELAIQTRANTRRNKGQSKPPRVALQHLTAETVEIMSTRMHANENSKCVGWDERLVYYRDCPDATREEGKEEKRPRVQRLRGLGSANGTPAVKRVADVAGSPEIPAPRRRGKPR